MNDVIIIKIAGARDSTVNIIIILRTDTRSEGFWELAKERLKEGSAIPEVPGIYVPAFPAASVAKQVEPLSKVKEHKNSRTDNLIVILNPRFDLLFVILFLGLGTLLRVFPFLRSADQKMLYCQKV